MSYIVFARKWRPQTFDDVIGQEHVITTLKNAVSSHRLAHAYIFAGPRGVGKTSCARILAKSLNCQAGPTVKPCNKCSCCVEITESRSMDVIEIDGASNRGIEEIRALRENVKFSPSSGRFKIYIIDEVHMLTTEAFNALLKTLEEPPSHVKFIFATTQPQKIISTIVSRCQLLPFQRVPNIKIMEQLAAISLAEKVTLEDEVLLAIARASDGSLRDAESILDELVSFTKGTVRLDDVNAVLGIVKQDFLFELTQKIIQKDPHGALQLLDALIDEGKDTMQLVLNLIEHFRNLMIAKVATRNQEKLLDLPPEVCQRISAQAQMILLEEIFFSFNALLSAQEMAKRIDSLRIPLEIALVKLCSRGKIQEQFSACAPVPKGQPPDALPTPDTARERNSPAQRAQPTPLREKTDLSGEKTRDAGEGPSVVSIEKIKILWPQFVDRVSKIKVSAAHYLEEGRPFMMAGSMLSIGFPSGASFQKEALQRKENISVLESVIAELAGQAVRIQFLISQDLQKEKPSPDEVDPVVQSALDTFNGRVVRKG